MRRAAPSSLRRRLEFIMIGVALVSVLLLSGVNYVFARQLIGDSLHTQLGAIRDTRVQAVEHGAQRVAADVSTLGVTPAVVAALDELSGAFHELDDEITAEEIVGLEALYDEMLEPARAVGIEVTDRPLVPASTAGRYVQRHYILENPDGFDDRDRLDDAGDGSTYSSVHAQYHPLLRELMNNTRMSDLLLVDAGTREVVYTTKKRIDVGTDLDNGPYADSQLGEVVDQLASVPIGDAVISDSAFYLPARGAAVVFVATAVRSGSEVIGAVVAELPVDSLTEIITAGAGWDLLGLGESGDIYLVGSDDTLRTDPRPWIDDSEQFLADYADHVGDDGSVAVMELLDSAALVVRADNEAVAAAQRGETFVGTVENPFGVRTLAASAPVEIGDLDWVVVVEQNRAESRDALGSLWRSMLLVIAILLPLTALLGVVLARGLTAPFETLVAAAARIAHGEGDADVEDLGANELGDVGRQIEAVARQLESREQAILAEEQQITDVLNAVLPPRLVDRVRRGEQGIDDLVDTATVVSVTVGEIPDAVGADQDLVVELLEHINEALDTLLDRYGVDRVRRSSANALFVVGLDRPDACVDDGARFAAAILDLVADVGREFGQTLTARAGVASGEVATGVIGRSQVSFGVWGDPVSVAVSLDAVAQPGEILVDEGVTGALSDAWNVGEPTSLPGLDEDLVAFAITLVADES